MNRSMIEVRSLSKTFRTKHGTVHALNDINLSIAEGDIFGMIFQQFNLLMQRTAEENVCFPLRIAGVRGERARQKAAKLKEKGYELQVKEFTDYVLPNKALENKDLDANYFQHQPDLDQFNKENGTDIVSAGAIYYEPFGIYAGKTKKLSDLKDGATVAVPNDVSNETRALLLFQEQGLIKLKDGAGINATQKDIVENKKNLKFKELEAAQLVRALPDVDVAVINGNYAIEGGLKVADALAVEADDSLAAKTYANIIAVRKGDENREDIKALVEVLKSDEIKTYIQNTFGGAVVPVQ